MKGKEINRVDVAAFYGVTTRTIHDWEKAGLPIVTRGGGGRSNLYNSLQVHQFLLDREIANRVITVDGEGYDKQEEEARLKHHQANNEALKEAEATGRLMKASVVVELCSSLVSNARARFLVLHNTIKNRHPTVNQIVIDDIEKSIIDALNELGTDGLPNSLRASMAQHNNSLDSAPETDG